MRFTNIFRCGMLPSLTRNEDEISSTVHAKYRLRRYRVRRKKHPKPVHYVDDQKEEFKKRKIYAFNSASFDRSRSSDLSGSASVLPSGQASRYKVLGQVRQIMNAPKKQSARVKLLHSFLSKNRSSDSLKMLANPESVQDIKIDDHRFHPVEIYSWEEDIIFDDQIIDNNWATRRLVPKFVDVKQQVPQSRMGAVSPMMYNSPLMSYLASRIPSGYSTPPIIRPPSQNMPSLLKRPQCEATRVTNVELENGNWEKAIIWDDEKVPECLPSTKLILDVNDPYMTFDVEEKGEGGGISLKDLSRLNKLISKAKAKKGLLPNGATASLLQQAMANQPTKAINYSKCQTGDKFNLSNDKYYEASTNVDGSATVSKAIRQSMVKSQMSSRISLQHSVPALKLIAPFFNSGWTKTDLRSWHRPTLSKPLEPKLTFNQIGTTKKKESTSVASQVLRNAKKLGLRDGSEYVLLEYSEDYPLLLMNPGMATFLQHCYRRNNVKEVVPAVELSFGSLKVLEPTDPSPFYIFGDIPHGKVLPVIQNNLFRAPLFEHDTSNHDFLVIRSHVKGKVGSKLYLRPLPSKMILVGQEIPVTEVPGPHSRKQNVYSRSRIQVFSYRLFSKDATANITGRARLKIGRILSSFPQYSEGSVRKWLKEYAESVRAGKDSGIWQKKSDAPVLTEDDLRAMVTPEMVCAYESMLVGQQRLQDAGLELQLKDDDAIDDEHLIDDDASGEIQLAPWNLTANVASAIIGKSALQLRGHGDPSGGRGEAFSFVRIPTKMAQAKIPDASGPNGIQTIDLYYLLSLDEPALGMKRTKGGSLDQVAYKQEIAKIWQAQLKVLSDPTPPFEDNCVDTGKRSEASAAVWNDIFREEKGADDDETASVNSASQTATSTGAQSTKSRKRLVITRAIRDEHGEVQIAPEIVTDPFLIQAYLKERRQIDAKNKRRQQLAAASAARSAQRPPKEPKPPKIPREPRPQKPKKMISSICGACGMVGHMKTNRICPMYSLYEAEQKAMFDSGAVKVDGTKLTISKSTLEKVIKKPSSTASLMTIGQQRALSQWSLFLQDIIAALVALPTSWPFRKPVSKKEYPHYFHIITKPVDLSTMRSRAKRNIYRIPESFLNDMRLMADNCLKFNLEEHPFTGMAKDLVSEAEKLLDQKKDQVNQWMNDLQSRPIQSTESQLDSAEPDVLEI